MKDESNCMAEKDDKICLIDMDGTICDYEGPMSRDLKSLASPNEPEVTSFHDGEPHIEARMEMIKEQVGWWKKLPRLHLGYRIMLEARVIGFDIHICTKGPRTIVSAWAEKKQWCNDNLIGIPHKLHITEDKGVFYGKILVDDYPPYVERWLEWRPRGLIIMPSYSYNEHFSHPRVLKATMDNIPEVVAAMRKRYEE